MFKNFFLLFIRNFRRQKMFSFINLLGLTVSMVSTLMIYLYVRHEFSYDQFHKDADRIYRVNQTFIWGENDNHQFGSTGPGVATALLEELPEIELMTSLHTHGNYIFTYSDANSALVNFEEDRVLIADSNFFKMFNFPVIKGDPDNALLLANTLVLTETTARKYFGSDDPIGKLLQANTDNGQRTFEVTAVVKDTPNNSYLEFDMLMSMASIPAVKRLYWSWVWTQLETFVRFGENTNMENTRARLATIPRKHAEETLKGVMNTTYDEYIKSGKKWDLFLQPLTSIHLPSELVYNRISPPGNITIIYSLIGAAIFIILLSCINFMNLSTAQFMRRIKEASMRKILGIGRSELSLSYFLEAITFCLVALIAAVALAQLFLPGFNLLTGKTLSLDLLRDTNLVVSLFSLVIFMALLSGSYPAMFLSSFKPAEALKGKLKTGQEGKRFRNGLVVFQFSASIVLIICTSIVFEQLRFFSEKDLGFDKENLLVLSHAERVKNAETFVNEALNLPGVENATLCTSLPPTIWGGDAFTASETSDKKFNLNFTSSDERFIPTLRIKMKLGRNFSQENLGDSTRIILNESAVKRIGWAMDETVIGKKIEYAGSSVRFEVVGVVDDFNYWSLQSGIEPMGIFHIKSGKIVGDGSKQYIAVRIKGQNSAQWETSISELQKIWQVQAGDTPFDYSFVDKTFAQAFKSEAQFGNVLTVMAGLAILIASLGLLGMIIYALELRTKEIGIRKVSGASNWNILTLISKSYAILILVAFLIGAPLSYWMMKQWLQEFAYRITPSPWLFATVGVGTLFIALTITCYHSIKAATMNPVDVLKDE